LNEERKCFLLALALVGSAGVGCFDGRFLVGQPCEEIAERTDCGPHLECRDGFCGGCPVQVDGVCLCAPDLERESGLDCVAIYNEDENLLFPPQCLEGVCVRPDMQPDYKLAYELDGWSIAVPRCETDSDDSPFLQTTQQLCFYADPEISDECMATGSNLQVGFLFADANEVPPIVGLTYEPVDDCAN
jgi:hypothetical protein